MRVLVALFAVILTSCTAGSTQDNEWETDFNLASARAERESKYMLLNFSGSDWCVWCEKLDIQVFNTPEFKAYARHNLVCVVVDFPVTKAQNRKIKQQNGDLALKYKISGFPSIVILNSEGDLIHTTGYLPCGAKQYVEHLKGIINEYEKKCGLSVS